MNWKTRELASPREYRADCPLTLASALLAGLEPDPARRVAMPGFLAKLDAAADELTEDVEEHEDAPPAAVSSPPAVAASPPPVEVAPAASPPEPLPAVAASPPPATVAASASPPPVTPPPAHRPSWPLVVAGAAIALVALGLGWWGGRISVPSTPPPVREVVAAASEPPAPAPVVADNAARPTPTLLPMRDALALATAELRRCASLADGLLLVHFATDEGAERFTDVQVRGDAEDAVQKCVRDTVAPLRFQPAAADSFTREYTP